MLSKAFQFVIKNLLFQGLFVASLIFSIFSAIQIATADSHIENSLQEWERTKEALNAQPQDQIKPIRTPAVLTQNVTTSLEKDDSAHLESVAEETETEPVPFSEAESVEERDVENVANAAQEKITISAELEPGKVIGKIMIPTIDKELPIIHGTESKHLKKGVGHYIGTALPGEHQHSVLAGHRDTVFRGLENLQIGDRFEVETIKGLFTYEVEQLEIVDSDDRTIIVPRDEAILTLITCYPFYYVGDAPQRYIVTGRMVDPVD